MARPEKPIDWKKVDELLMADCKGTEIAPHFDMHVNTFYDKCFEYHKVGFTEYSASKKNQGDSLIKAKQLEKALRGDNTLLIWLGKCRIGQKENQEQQADPNILAAFELVMKQIQSIQDKVKADQQQIHDAASSISSNDKNDLNNSSSDSIS